MARFYIDTEPAHLETSKLDQVIDRLLEVYDCLDDQRMRRVLNQATRQR